MAKVKKTAKKTTPRKSNIIEVNVATNAIATKNTSVTKPDSISMGKPGPAKIYPPIYTYIYEREPEDMARIYEEHKSAKDSPKKAVKKITGFKMIGGKLVAIGK